jgi:hypothetical protein
MRGHRSLAQEAVFDRAAILVLDLAKADGGIPIKELLIPPENMQVFGTASTCSTVTTTSGNRPTGAPSGSTAPIAGSSKNVSPMFDGAAPHVGVAHIAERLRF